MNPIVDTKIKRIKIVEFKREPAKEGNERLKVKWKLLRMIDRLENKSKQ